MNGLKTVVVIGKPIIDFGSKTDDGGSMLKYGGWLYRGWHFSSQE